VGNALRPKHHEEDVALMLEMGVNAVVGALSAGYVIL